MPKVLTEEQYGCPQNCEDRMMTGEARDRQEKPRAHTQGNRRKDMI